MKSHKKIEFVVLMTLCLICIGNLRANEKIPDKIKAGCMGTRNIDVLPKMVSEGMNVALVKFGYLRLPIFIM